MYLLILILCLCTLIVVVCAESMDNYINNEEDDEGKTALVVDAYIRANQDWSK